MNFDSYLNKLPYARKIQDPVMNKAWVQEGHDLEKQFKIDLFDDLGITGNPKAELLFSKAYEIGHSSGYSEVYNAASDLVDLIL